MFNLTLTFTFILSLSLLLRAAAYIKIEELQKALEDCKTAVRLKPDYARAHGRMG